MGEVDGAGRARGGVFGREVSRAARASEVTSDRVVAAVRAGLAPLADPDAAVAMQRYLKTDMPMLGVKRPDQKRVFRDAMKAHPPRDRAEWASAVEQLWAGPERELKHAAIAWAGGFRKRFLDPDAVPLLERMVREGAWWDLVDDIAAHLVGHVVLRHRDAMRPMLERWIADPDLWVRRTALLAQIRHGEDADGALLFDTCLRQANDTSFWIRKAIGWALREHAKTDPDAVRAFLAAHGSELSGLSRREASKHL